MCMRPLYVCLWVCEHAKEFQQKQKKKGKMNQVISAMNNIYQRVRACVCVCLQLLGYAGSGAFYQVLRLLLQLFENLMSFAAV